MKYITEFNSSPTKFVADSCLYVLRNSNGQALNVSYSEDGLKMTTNKIGRLMYYSNSYLTNGSIPYDAVPSTRVYVERFTPGVTKGRAIAEATWALKKATHLRYGRMLDSPSMLLHRD